MTKSQGAFAGLEMTYNVSSGTLNPTHSLTPTSLRGSTLILQELNGCLWLASGQNALNAQISILNFEKFYWGKLGNTHTPVLDMAYRRPWADAPYERSGCCGISGYGNMVPYSTDARIFCCLYAIFGIPLCLCALVVIGDRLSAMTSWIQRRIRCRSMTAATGPGAKRCESICRAVVPASLGLLVFILLPSVVFMVVQDWDYATALYFSVISLSTIGFGDYVAGAFVPLQEIIIE